MSCEFDSKKYEKYHKEKDFTWNPFKYIIKITIIFLERNVVIT